MGGMVRCQGEELWGARPTVFPEKPLQPLPGKGIFFWFESFPGRGVAPASGGSWRALIQLRLGGVIGPVAFQLGQHPIHLAKEGGCILVVD